MENLTQDQIDMLEYFFKLDKADQDGIMQQAIDSENCNLLDILDTVLYYDIQDSK